MVRVSLFEAAADKYVSQVFNFPHTRVIECNKRYAHHGHPSQIELLLLGEPLDDGTIENARTQMGSFGLDKAELVVRQANTTDKIDVASLQQSYLELLEEKNRRIGEMRAAETLPRHECRGGRHFARGGCHDHERQGHIAHEGHYVRRFGRTARYDARLCGHAESRI